MLGIMVSVGTIVLGAVLIVGFMPTVGVAGVRGSGLGGTTEPVPVVVTVVTGGTPLVELVIFAFDVVVVVVAINSGVAPVELEMEPVVFVEGVAVPVAETLIDFGGESPLFGATFEVVVAPRGCNAVVAIKASVSGSGGTVALDDAITVSPRASFGKEGRKKLFWALQEATKKQSAKTLENLPCCIPSLFIELVDISIDAIFCLR